MDADAAVTRAEQTPLSDDTPSEAVTVGSLRSVALISSMAVTLVNFRGPLIREFISRGMRVYALAPDFSDDIRREIRELQAEPVDISLDRTGMRPVRDAIDFFLLTRKIRQLSPDVTFSYFIKPVIYGCIAAKLSGVPRRFALVAGLGYVFTDSGSDQSVGRRILRRVVTELYRAAFRVCDCVLFQNKDDAAYFTNRRAITPNKLLLVNGTGVNLPDWVPAEPVTSPVTFLLVARLLREKGIYEYVEAARRIRAKHSDVRFILLGDLDRNPGALPRSEVERWVAEGVFEWPGHVQDVRPWLRKASVFVLPSYREGMPRSTQEAMAMAKPIITTNAAGCRDTVEDGVNGYLVPVQNVDALSEAMMRFIETPSLIRTMGEASRRLAEEKFDVHRINEKILRAMGIS